MATNNNNISITSFNKGMNTDVSYSNIQEGQYLYGENIRVSSYNGDKKIDATNSYVELSITHIEKQNVMFAILKDITDRVCYNQKLNEMKLETIATTDDVIKKQMRVAQEIASLLGETTAETKVALVKLKKMLNENNEGEQYGTFS